MEYKTVPGVHGKIPAHLPDRLTISFPIWGLMDTAPDGAYHDTDRMVREHAERGFNCIRLESGAGLTHDLDGSRLPPANIVAPYGPYSDNRQAFCIGGEGKCDYLQRLIDLCRSCQKYDVYLILSSWFFLHTYWYCDEETNRRLFGIGTDNWFLAFAKFLHYILCELEARGLADRIAAAEIFNEVCDLPNHWAYNSPHTPQTIWTFFREKHEEALAFLEAEHPNILFSCDDTARGGVMALHPRNMQCFNGHNYFLWGVYGGALERDGKDPADKRGDFFRGKVTLEDVVHSRDGRWQNSSPDWFTRLRYSHDVDPEKLPALEAYLENRLNTHWDEYVQNLENAVYWYRRIMEDHPDIPVMCGEGVTYCSSKIVRWEEKSERYWEMVQLAMDRYRAAGLWGTVVKTCCGPEDPCWDLCPDRLLALNTRFQEGA